MYCGASSLRHNSLCAELFASRSILGVCGRDVDGLTVVLIRARDTLALIISAVDGGQMAVLGIAVLLVGAVLVGFPSCTQDKQAAENQQ